ncbi:hypothetical protein BLOT_002951 [Blomia tropicalis]|nr:hypothetical protein BLOT_002951 [Blomia tropicalis]
MDISQVPNFNSSNELSSDEVEEIEQPRPNKRQRVFKFSEQQFETLSMAKEFIKQQQLFQFKSTSNSKEDSPSASLIGKSVSFFIFISRNSSKSIKI